MVTYHGSAMMDNCMDLVTWPMTIQWRLHLASVSMVNLLLMFCACMFHCVWLMQASNALHATGILWTSSGYVLRFSRQNLNMLMILSQCSPFKTKHRNIMKIMAPPGCFLLMQDVKLQELEDLVEDLRLQRRHRVPQPALRFGCFFPQGYSWGHW